MNAFTRRQFLATGFSCAAGGYLASQVLAENLKSISLSQQIEGMLVGSVLGDAMGGPLEFDENKIASSMMPNLRDWKDERRILPVDLAKLARNLPLFGYEKLRPDVAPYGPWSESAPAGTATDDTRHKIVLMDTLRRGLEEDRPITVQDMATSYLAFDDHACHANHPEYAPLLQEGHEEYRLSARWVLGERDPDRALPPQRMWAGAQTCCGMMTLLPLAGVFPGEPEKAYRAAYRLGFFDNGWAKDLTSAVIAALSTALTLQADPTVPEQRRQAWQQLEATMLRTDPYRYEAAPYTEKPSTRWIEYAHRAVREAKGSPKRLFESLEKECFQNHWWESHLIFSIPFACAEFCDYNPLAAMHMVLDFGWDTDSSAQLLGALIGALHGPEVFPAEMRQTVKRRLKEDYLEDLDEWTEVLEGLAGRPKGLTSGSRSF